MASQGKNKVLSSLHETAKALLDVEWNTVMSISNIATARDVEWGVIFEQLISSGGSTYPYVLLGQVLVKASDGKVNALCLQDSSQLSGARDVRMLVKNVVVPWNRTVGKPFPGSNLDPYVNNPARYKNFGSDSISITLMQ
jgi:SacI restriction endonuclease